MTERSREPVQHRFGAPDGDICWFEWGEAQAGRPSLLLLHATGFHARLWDALVDCLPPDQHVIAPDARGHGRSFRPPTLGNWMHTAGDIVSLVDALNVSELVVTGHSMGGFCGAVLAAQRPERVARLVLVDPVIMDPVHYTGVDTPLTAVSDHPVARRRNQWDSVAQMVERMAARSPYDAWLPDVLDDYCRYGLLPLDNGGFELGCPPALEASVYLSSALSDPYAFIADIRCPVTVIRAKQEERAGLMDFSNSPTWSGLAAALRDGRDLQWDDQSHFIPMENPARLAKLVVQELETAR